MKTAYFHIRETKTVGEKMVLNGNYILPATIEVNTGGSGSDSPGPGSLPDIKVPGPFKVKWIILPGDNGAKAMAESMGYETVELGDFSYPPPR